MNQGRDSTIEPAYLAEKKEVAPEPEPVLIEKTYEVPIPGYIDQIEASADDADGYSLVNLVGPTDSTWAPVELTVDEDKGTVVINSTSEQLTAAYQNGKTNFYIRITQAI